MFFTSRLLVNPYCLESVTCPLDLDRRRNVELAEPSLSTEHGHSDVDLHVFWIAVLGLLEVSSRSPS